MTFPIISLTAMQLTLGVINITLFQRKNEFPDIKAA